MVDFLDLWTKELAILERLKHIAGAATVLIYRIYEILTKCVVPDLGKTKIWLA